MKLKVYKTTSDFESLASQWDMGFHFSPFSCFMWNYASWKFFHESKEQLHIVILENAKYRIIFPLKSSRSKNKKTLTFINSPIFTDYNHPIITYKASPSALNLAKSYNQIFQFLLISHNEIILHNISQRSNLYREIFSTNIFNKLRVAITHKIACPRVDLSKFVFAKMPASYIADIKSKLRKIGDVKLEVVKDQGELLEILSLFFKLNKSWWKLKDSNGLIQNNCDRKFFIFALPRMLAKKRLCCSVVKIHNQIASISIDFIDDDSFYLYIPARNPRHKQLGIGKIHMFLLFEMLLSQRKFRYVDFMRGQEAYKYQWLATNEYNTHIRITS